MAEQPSDEQRSEILEIFRHFDHDKNGTMEARELASLLTTLGGDSGADELDAAIEALDVDHNGKIDFDEFVAWWSQR
jgi:calmodulin